MEALGLLSGDVKWVLWVTRKELSFVLYVCVSGDVEDFVPPWFMVDD